MAGNHKGRRNRSKNQPRGALHPPTTNRVAAGRKAGASRSKAPGPQRAVAPTPGASVPGQRTAATDLPAGVRGAWRGLLVLFFGELLAPIVGQLVPVLGSLWLSLVGAAGFVVAGMAIGRAQRPTVQGALAALGALALTMPLRLLTHERLSVLAYLVNFTFAIVVGGASGLIAGRRREPA